MSVEFEVSGSVGVVRLARSERRNVLDETMVRDLARAFERAENAPEVTAIVLTGAGPVFCAGASLDTLLASADGGFAEVEEVYEGFLRVLRSPLPTIAAVNGPAVGAGLNLALACDVRIASSTARFESRFAALRLHPGGGHTWLLEKAVGRQTATLMAMFGEVLDAEQALGHGLVASVHEPEALVDAAVEIGRRLEGLDGDYVRLVARSLREAEQTLEHRAMLEVETERQRWSTLQPDFRRGVRAIQDRISSRRRDGSGVV